MLRLHEQQVTMVQVDPAPKQSGPDEPYKEMVSDDHSQSKPPRQGWNIFKKLTQSRSRDQLSKSSKDGSKSQKTQNKSKSTSSKKKSNAKLKSELESAKMALKLQQDNVQKSSSSKQAPKPTPSSKVENSSFSSNHDIFGGPSRGVAGWPARSVKLNDTESEAKEPSGWDDTEEDGASRNRGAKSSNSTRTP